MQKLFSTLNTIPEMSAGVYTRFSVTLYTLVKQYYPKLDVILLKTKDNIAVISLNGIILNPYIGIEIDYDLSSIKEEGIETTHLDFFLEKKVPESKEAVEYIEALSEVLVLASKNIPLTIENVARYQSKIYSDSLAVDVYWNSSDINDDLDSIVYPRKGEIIEILSTRRKQIQKLKTLNPKSLKPALIRDTNFRFPEIKGMVTDIKISWINPDLEIDIINTVNEKTCCETVSVENIIVNNSHNFSGDGTEDLTIHFVPGSKLPSGLFKPFSNLDALETYSKGGDFVGGGLFNLSKNFENIRYQAYSKNNKSLVLDPKVPLFTMILIIDSLTVHKITDAEEASISMPL